MGCKFIKGRKLFEKGMSFFNLPCDTKENVDDKYPDLCAYLYYKLNNFGNDRWPDEFSSMSVVTDTLYLYSILSLKREILHSLGFPVLCMRKENLNQIHELINKANWKTKKTAQKNFK